MLDPQSAPVTDELSTQVVRSFDADAINRIANDPSVYPSVAGASTDKIDLTDWVANHNNVLLLADGGAIFFAHDIELGIYEVHTNFLENYRGRHAIECSRNAYRWMFTHTDCMIIHTRIPAFNRPAAMAARHIGFVPQFTRKDAWATPNGKVDLKFYSLPYEAWLKTAAKDLMASGRAFHQHLDAERVRLGHSEDPKHPDEDCHDLYVGACLETVYGGQPEKAVILYNRWARLAGYGQIAMVARSPLVIDIGDAVLMVEDQSFKVIKCRPAH